MKYVYNNSVNQPHHEGNLDSFNDFLLKTMLHIILNWDGASIKLYSLVTTIVER